MVNNSFCKVTFLLFVAQYTLVAIEIADFIKKEPTFVLLSEKHNSEIQAIKSEKLQIGKNLMPKLSINLGQTVSSNSCDTQTWGSFSAAGTIIDFTTKHKIKQAELTIKQTELNNNLEMDIFYIQTIKNIFIKEHLIELEGLLEAYLKTLEKIYLIIEKGFKLGVLCQHKSEDLELAKSLDELRTTSSKKEFYIQQCQDNDRIEYQSESSINIILSSLFEKTKKQTLQQSDFFNIKKNKLENEIECTAKEYLPKVDFGVTTSNNRLYMFHKNWDLRAGITLKWNFFDFGANAEKAKYLSSKKDVLDKEIQINQSTNIKSITLKNIDFQDLLAKLNQIFTRVSILKNKVRRSKKLNSLGKTSLYQYLLEEKSIGSELINLSKEKHQLITKILSL